VSTVESGQEPRQDGPGDDPEQEREATRKRILAGLPDLRTRPGADPEGMGAAASWVPWP
jgi:hypothetical protein